MIRIKNDTGATRDTRFIDTTTGRDLTELLSITYGATITLDRGEVQATLLIETMPAIDVKARPVWRTRNPLTGGVDDVAAITFRDGSRVEFGETGSVLIVPAKGPAPANPPNPAPSQGGTTDERD